VRRMIALVALVLASVGVGGCFGGGGGSGWTVWDSLAQCEAGGNWAANTGNGYYGGLQFSLSTWLGYGGGEFAYWPYQATREQQIIVGERVVAGQGWGAWPYCSSTLGLR
jgi:hypothetical protein